MKVYIYHEAIKIVVYVFLLKCLPIAPRQWWERKEWDFPSIRASVTFLFPHDSGLTAQGIDIKLCGYIHYGALQIWSTLVMLQWVSVVLWPLVELSRSTEFPAFPSLWLVGQFLHICRQAADCIRLKWLANSLWASPGLINFWSMLKL